MKFNYSYSSNDKGCLYYVALILIAIVVACAALALEGWLLMMLWNAVIVPWLGWSALNFWWSVGIITICNILFGGSKVNFKGE